MSDDNFSDFQKGFDMSAAMGKFKKIRDALVAGGFSIDESLKIVALLLLLGQRK